MFLKHLWPFPTIFLSYSTPSYPPLLPYSLCCLPFFFFLHFFPSFILYFLHYLHIFAAMRRRFQKRVYIALPEARARAHMLKLNLGIHFLSFLIYISCTVLTVTPFPPFLHGFIMKVTHPTASLTLNSTQWVKCRRVTVVLTLPSWWADELRTFKHHNSVTLSWSYLYELSYCYHDCYDHCHYYHYNW